MDLRSENHHSVGNEGQDHSLMVSVVPIPNTYYREDKRPLKNNTNKQLHGCKTLKDNLLVWVLTWDLLQMSYIVKRWWGMDVNPYK